MARARLRDQLRSFEGDGSWSVTDSGEDGNKTYLAADLAQRAAGGVARDRVHIVRSGVIPKKRRCLCSVRVAEGWGMNASSLCDEKGLKGWRRQGSNLWVYI